MELLSHSITDPVFLVILSFICGLFAAFLAWKFLQTSSTMVMTVMVLPAVVCAALLVINGSLGNSVAILGVFGLVRFRSMPGSGTDLIAIFYAMVIGLIMSTTYYVSGLILSLLLGLFIIIAVKVMEKAPIVHSLHILVPEDCENLDLFEEILNKYARNVRLERIRTTNMGSMYELVYTLIPTKGAATKMLDDIRVHNHNLNVALTAAKQDGSL